MSILDILFPKRCIGCGRVGSYFCSRCLLLFSPIQSNEAICPVCSRLAIDGATHPKCRTRYSIDGLTSFFRYRGVVRKTIKAIKYRLVSDMVREFVSRVPSTTLDPLCRFPSPVIVPIPLHILRERNRGFNQAECIGSSLATRLHIPMRTDMLRRTKQTVPQVSLNRREDRIANMRGIFVAHISHAYCPSVLLVDDVFTTGATLRSAANVLKRSGVPIVWGVTMAR